MSSCVGIAAAALAASALDAAARARAAAAEPQQFLCFCFDPQGHSLLRGGRFCSGFFLPGLLSGCAAVTAPSSASLGSASGSFDDASLRPLVSGGGAGGTTFPFC